MYDHTIAEVPEGLEALQKTQHLFIKQSGLPIECLYYFIHVDYIPISHAMHKANQFTVAVVIFTKKVELHLFTTPNQTARLDCCRMFQTTLSMKHFVFASKIQTRMKIAVEYIICI